jgi:voltage-gated potassium channel
MVMLAEDEPRIAAWDRRVDWWLTGLAVVFLGGYAWQVLDTSLGPGGHDALELLLTAAWAVFGVDFLVRLALAHRRGRYLLRHLPDLLVLLLPMLRPLRALRAVLAIGVLNRQLRDNARGRVAFYVAGTVVLVGFVASVAVFDAERDAPDASITTFGDALWWTVTTVSTVGYGDRYPVTGEGRLVAVLLMLAGIALLGVVTAAVASWFVGRVTEATRDEGPGAQARAELLTEVRELADQVRVLRAELASARGPSGS